MKKYIISALLAFAAVAVYNPMNAYNFIINNKSGKLLLTQVELYQDKTPYFQICPADRFVTFDWRGSMYSYCLNSIRCVMLEGQVLTELLNKNFIKKSSSTEYSVVDAAKLLKWVEDGPYRLSVIMKDKQGKVEYGDFCGNYTFTLTSDGKNIFSSWISRK